MTGKDYLFGLWWVLFGGMSLLGLFNVITLTVPLMAGGYIISLAIDFSEKKYGWVAIWLILILLFFFIR